MKSEKGTEKLFFKYNEDDTLTEVLEYIVGTYSEHYGDQNFRFRMYLSKWTLPKNLQEVLR